MTIRQWKMRKKDDHTHATKNFNTTQIGLNSGLYMAICNIIVIQKRSFLHTNLLHTRRLQRCKVFRPRCLNFEQWRSEIAEWMESSWWWALRRWPLCGCCSYRRPCTSSCRLVNRRSVIHSAIRLGCCLYHRLQQCKRSVFSNERSSIMTDDISLKINYAKVNFGFVYPQIH